MSKFKDMMNKKLGEGTFFAFDGQEHLMVQPIPTAIPSLDFALGIGGFPVGRIIELFGEESCGKTTLCLQVVAQYQKYARDKSHPFHKKPYVAYIDAENALDPLHVARLGVDMSEETGMLVNQPDYGEQAFDIMEAAIHSGQCGLIIVDSVANLIPKKELEGTNEDQQMGLLARIMAKGLRKITKPANENDTTVIFINQTREKVGVMYGDPTTTPGGKALKFYSSVRIRIKRKEIKKTDTILGQTMTFNIIKNKVARPFMVSEVDYYFDTLFDTQKDIMNTAIDMQLINRAGAWYFLGESTKNPSLDAHGNQLKWQGKIALEDSLKDSPALFAYINDLVQGNIPKDAQYIEEDYHESEEIPEEVLQEELEIVN